MPPIFNMEQFEGKFFHGTTANIKGKTLKPSAKTKTENYDYDDFSDTARRRNSVFMTKDNHDRPAEHGAWVWGSTGTNNFYESGNRVKKRTHVYEVKPVGQVENDSAVSGSQMAPSARILRRIDIPPEEYAKGHMNTKNWTVHEGHGVQGTLPGHNWDLLHDKNAEAEGFRRQGREEIARIGEESAMRMKDLAQIPLFSDRRYRRADHYEDNDGTPWDE